jgi:hypothetical protein
MTLIPNSHKVQVHNDLAQANRIQTSLKLMTITLDQVQANCESQS